MARKKQIKDLDQIDGKAKPSPRKRVKKKIQEVEHINGKVELSPVDKAKQAAQDLDKPFAHLRSVNAIASNLVGTLHYERGSYSFRCFLPLPG